MPTPINITGPSQSIDAKEPVNFLRVPGELDGEPALFLLGRYGLDLFSTIGGNAIRGMIEMKDIALVVAGNKCYTVANNGVTTEKGTLDTSTGIVGIAGNGLQVMIVDGTSGYIFTISGATFAKITDADFSGGNDVSFINGYFIVDNITGGTMQVSGLWAGSTWNAVDKATPEADPDGLVRVMPVHGDAWAMGETTIEPWYDASQPTGFPFLKRQGAYIDMGLAARWGACKADNTLYWLAQNKEGLFGIVRANGYTPEKISTPALDYELRGYSTVLDCEAWSFTDRGHTLIYFTFPTAGKTKCFDATMGMWSEDQSWGLSTYRCRFHMFFNQAHILGDRTTGKLYMVNWNTYRDNGDPIESIGYAQYIGAMGLPLEINSLKVLAKVGVGPMEESGQEEPMLMLEWSKDNKKTWSNSIWRSLGWQGQYKKRVIFNRLGTSENWDLRIKITSPCERLIKGAIANPQVGVE